MIWFYRGQCEKLRKEMDRANRKYTERRELWRKCVEKRENYDERRHNLLQWLDGSETRISTIPSNEAADMGKAITDFAGLAKEIMTRLDDHKIGWILCQIKWHCRLYMNYGTWGGILKGSSLPIEPFLQTLPVWPNWALFWKFMMTRLLQK